MALFEATCRKCGAPYVTPDRDNARMRLCAACDAGELALKVASGELRPLACDCHGQRKTEANERHSGVRNPLGIGRSYAARGDGTPSWMMKGRRGQP